MFTANVSAAVTRTAELRDLDDLARALDDLRERVTRAGRDPREISVQINGTLSVDEGLERRDEHLAQIDALAAMGVTDVVVVLPSTNDLGALTDAIAAYGEQVISANE
jgi:hypothetical protein